MSSPDVTRFAQLALAPAVLQAVEEVGYESPSPIQARGIPPLLEGRDLLGQAQTGTGKTAAFALPLLSRLDLSRAEPQILVLTPTRELAIQVAEAMQTYARHLEGFHILPVYGGQGMDTQLRHLRRGVHVVVGTPGRILDHLGRGTLKLDGLASLVLDEADEMLRMGFIDDVEQILKHTPADRQVALFSATMPPPIRRVASQHLKDPVEVRIQSKTATVATTTQRYWQVSGLHKLDALTRILEVEEFDAMLVFVRTKTATADLAERLEARGYASAALNGDMTQPMREKTVERLKGGSLDIVVATDVAARGLDVGRISHVLNYDIPYDTEAYVHRIGRTGRAGRKGQAILFVSPRERRMLRAIEQATGQPIEPMRIPTHEDISDRRIATFKQRITDILESEELGFFEDLIGAYQQEHDTGLGEIAAALAFLVQQERPLMLKKTATPVPKPPAVSRDRAPSRHRGADRGPVTSREGRPERGGKRPRPQVDAAESPDTARKGSPDRVEKRPRADTAELPDTAWERRPLRLGRAGEPGMLRYRVEVGREHGVEPKNIVGAIANEAGLDSQHIGQIKLYDTFSTVDLPEGMPREIRKHLKSVWVCGQKLEISLVKDSERPARKPHPSTARPKEGPPGKRSKAATPRPKTRARNTVNKGKPRPKPKGERPARSKD